MYYVFLFKLTGCDEGWFFIEGRCYSLHSNYVFDNTSDDVFTTLLSHTEALSICEDMESDLPEVFADNAVNCSKIKTYFRIWNHTDQQGNVLIGQEGDMCKYIKVGIARGITLLYFWREK